MTSNTRTKNLESQLVSLIQMPLADVVPFFCVENGPQKNVRNHNKNLKSYTPSIYQANKKSTVENMKFGMGALEEHNYAHAPTFQPSTINYRHVRKMVGVCIDMTTLESSRKS